MKVYPRTSERGMVLIKFVSFLTFLIRSRMRRVRSEDARVEVVFRPGKGSTDSTLKVVDRVCRAAASLSVKVHYGWSHVTSEALELLEHRP